MTNWKKPLIFFSIAFLIVLSVFFLAEWEKKMNNPMKLCSDNRACPEDWDCCHMGCCAPITASPHTDNLKEYTPSSYLYDAWYTQWSVLFFLGILGGIIICCVWCCLCKRSPSTDSFIAMISCSCCMPTRRGTEIDSAGSLYPPPRYSRCGSFHQAPPPYSEVQSKPDLYPLVITCAEGEGKAGGNYLMVHYFRNYVIRPPGSLSATSTAESLNSSFICNAANEANSIIPPPYSCASTFEEYGPGVGCRRSMLRSMSSLTESRPPAPLTPLPPTPRHRTTTFRENQLYSPVENVDQPYDLSLEHMDCDMYCDGNCLAVEASSTAPHSPPNTEDIVFEHEAYGLRHIFHSPPSGACVSPKQATSPIQTSKNSLRRPTEERRQRRLDSIKRNIRKSSLYMPLSTAHTVRPSRISPGSRLSSRSAPATPCSNLVPNLLNFTHRASRHSSRSSRLDEEYDSLLLDMEQSRHMDHKF